MINSGVPEGPGGQVQPEARRAQQRQQQGEEGGQVEPEEPRSSTGMMAYNPRYILSLITSIILRSLAEFL